MTFVKRDLKVVLVTFDKQDWKQNPKIAEQMFNVFLIMRQLHEMLWYLTESLTLKQTHSIHDELNSICKETENLTYLSPDDLINFDVAKHREKVNTLLLKTSKLVRDEISSKQNKILTQKKLGRGLDFIGVDLRNANLLGANLRGAYLIAADIKNNNLEGTDVIGADFRDADIRGADLSKSIFLTQAQINSAKGDVATFTYSSSTLD